jgi:hypothetical protein
MLYVWVGGWMGAHVRKCLLCWRARYCGLVPLYTRRTQISFLYLSVVADSYAQLQLSYRIVCSRARDLIVLMLCGCLRLTWNFCLFV